VRCDCGYDFTTGVAPAPVRQTSAVKGVFGLVLILAHITSPNFGYTTGTGAQSDGYNFSVAAFYAGGAYLLYRALGPFGRVAASIFCLAFALLTCLLQLTEYRNPITALLVSLAALAAGAIVVTGYYKLRKPGWERQRLVVCVCLWTFGIGAFRHNPDLPRADFNRILAEASGRAPTTRSDTSETKVLRDFLRELISVRQQGMEVVAAAKTPELERLLTADSFSTRDSVEATLTQLHSFEQRYAKLIEAPATVGQHFQQARARLSGSRYTWYLKNVETGFEKGVARTRPIQTLQQSLIHAQIDLYQFAGENLDGISVRGDRVIVADASLRDQFNARFTRAKQLATEFNAARKTFEATQKSELEKEGLSLSDFDVAK